jgi:hypothetical protein
MGEKTPLPASLSRISVAFLERYGLALVFGVYAFILSLPVVLGVFFTVGLLLALGEVVHPFRAVASRLASLLQSRSCATFRRAGAAASLASRSRSE